MRAMDAPESLHSYVLSRSGVANDAQYPAKNGTSMLVKQQFEGGDIPMLELIQDVSLFVLHRLSPFLTVLLGAQQKGYTCVARRVAEAPKNGAQADVKANM